MTDESLAKKRPTEPQPDDPATTSINVHVIVADAKFDVEWATVGAEQNFVAVDANGDVWAFPWKPTATANGVWDGDDLEIDPDADDVAPVMIGRIGYGIDNWRETLVERPGGSGDD